MLSMKTASKSILNRNVTSLEKVNEPKYSPLMSMGEADSGIYSLPGEFFSQWGSTR